MKHKIGLVLCVKVPLNLIFCIKLAKYILLVLLSLVVLSFQRELLLLLLNLKIEFYNSVPMNICEIMITEILSYFEWHLGKTPFRFYSVIRKLVEVVWCLFSHAWFVYRR